jgi:hypothetical protein
MSRILIFITGLGCGFYLCRSFSTERVILAILITLLLSILIPGYLLHVGLSDFQEYEK